MVTRTLIAAIVLSTLCTSAWPGALPNSRPASQGFSGDRLAALSGYMEGAVERGSMVGGLGLIARNGKVVFEETWGQADREQGVPIREDTIFRIYSMSKPITSVALMTLYEAGHFELNEPIGKYIPELANLQVALSTADSAGGVSSDGAISQGSGDGNAALTGKTRAPTRQPTIQDLLRHTAGFTYGAFGNTEVDQLYRAAGYPNFNGDLLAFVSKLGEFPLQYEPGSRWHYSVAVAVQSRLVEVLSGKRFGAYLDEMLFEPLDMRDTGFQVPKEDLPRFAKMYAPEGVSPQGFGETPTGTGLVPAAPSMSRGYIEGTPLESGGIGLVSTARDYLRFAQMLLNGGTLNGQRILSPKTVRFMTRNHLRDLPMGLGRTGSGFGLGFAVVLDPAAAGEAASAGTYSWGGAAGTTFWVDPVEQIVGIFMVQSLPHRTRLKDKFRLMTYGALTESYDVGSR